jgi:hypothetical protein
VRGSVWQCVPQFAAVRQCGSVRLCAAVRTAVCGSARSSVCAAVHMAVYVWHCLQQCAAVWKCAHQCAAVQRCSSVQQCGNSWLRIISYTGCRRQTAPSCTTSLTIYIHTRHEPSPFCNSPYYIMYGLYWPHSPLLYHVAHNINSVAVACPLLQPAVAPKYIIYGRL